MFFSCAQFFFVQDGDTVRVSIANLPERRVPLAVARKATADFPRITAGPDRLTVARRWAEAMYEAQ